VHLLRLLALLEPLPHAVGGRDGKPDGIVGRLTRRAIEQFTMGTKLDLEDVLRRIRNYPRDRLAQILAD
jgi:hypothetical protein